MTPGYTRDDGIVRTQIKDNLTRIERKGGQAEWFKTTGMTNATKDPGEDSEYLRRHAAQNLAAAAEVDYLFQIGKTEKIAKHNTEHGKSVGG